MLEMQKALRSSKRLIAVLSPDYLDAHFPQPEWASVFASDPEGADRRLIPIMVRSCAPEGLLKQIVQIRIYDLDPDAAEQRLLDGVAAKRAKPVEQPPFPGNAVDAVTRDGADSVPSHDSGPTWFPLDSPPSMLWRGDLDNRLPNTSGYAAVELHLVPVGQQARLQVRELSDLERLLPDHGRRRGIFSPTEALTARCDGTKAVALSNERGKVAGISVTRPGQRSCWAGLPCDMLGAILDEKNLTEQLIVMLDTLADLPLRATEQVVPGIGVEPATMVSLGSVETLPRQSARAGIRTSNHIRPLPEDAVSSTDMRIHAKEVAMELAARMIAEHRTATGLR